MTNATNTADLENILAAQHICSEDGEHMVSFQNRNFDAGDFANVSRHDLETLIRAAFEAGRASR